MKTITLEEFREELLRTGRYESSCARLRKSPARAGLFTTLRFSWNIFSVFPKCAIYEALHILAPDKWAHFCFESIRGAENIGVKFTAEGWNQLKDFKEPAVFVANHMSTLETVMLPFILLTYRSFSTVVKASLAHLPGLEKAARHMGLIPIGRMNPREDLLTLFKVGTERLSQGESVLIFSQGTRQRVFARKGWSSIGAKLAEKAHVPVIPIAVKTDIQLAHPQAKGFQKDFGTVDPTKDIRAACGPVLRGRAREMHEASFDWIKSTLDAWHLPTSLD